MPTPTPSVFLSAVFAVFLGATSLAALPLPPVLHQADYEAKKLPVGEFAVPGVIVAAVTNPEHASIQTPSLIKANDDGLYLATFTEAEDESFGPERRRTTRLFVSLDAGLTWKHESTAKQWALKKINNVDRPVISRQTPVELEGFHSGTLFKGADGVVYLLGARTCTSDDGLAIVAFRYSTDAALSLGFNTRHNRAETHDPVRGDLVPAAPVRLLPGRFDGAATPVITAYGRHWRMMTELVTDSLGSVVGTKHFLLSAAVGADLLAPASWVKTKDVRIDTSPLNAEGGPDWWFSGNVVEGPSPTGSLPNLNFTNDSERLVGFLAVRTQQRPGDTFALTSGPAGSAYNLQPDARYHVAARMQFLKPVQGGCLHSEIRLQLEHHVAVLPRTVHVRHSQGTRSDKAVTPWAGTALVCASGCKISTRFCQHPDIRRYLIDVFAQGYSTPLRRRTLQIPVRQCQTTRYLRHTLALRMSASPTRL